MIPARACVVGATGRLGSLLVKKLLDRGYLVHATLRSISEPEKLRLLKSLPGADARLLLFEADLFEAQRFEQAIQGCQFVFLVAFPTRLNRQDPKKFEKEGEAHEAMLAALRTIVGACERSGSVRRLIYTGSITTASPLGENGLRCRDAVDESCWTCPDLPIDYAYDFVKFYVSSKTASERELLKYADGNGSGSPEMVILTCGLIGGDALVGNTAGVDELISPLTGDADAYGALVFLQNLLHSVPLVHQADAVEAHLFCMHAPLGRGRRVICASDYPSMRDVVAYYRRRHPDLLAVPQEPEESAGRISGGSTRLREMGFEYRYGMEQIIDDSVQFAKGVGLLKPRDGGLAGHQMEYDTSK